jgi:hypothetical protein
MFWRGKPLLSLTHLAKALGCRTGRGQAPPLHFFGWLLWVLYCAKILVWELNRTITPYTRKHPRY